MDASLVTTFWAGSFDIAKRSANHEGVAERRVPAYLLGMTETPQPKTPQPAPQTHATEPGKPAKPHMPKEIGGPAGPEPTRYGDWEVNGRCSDF
jgi:hypothetical protein